MSCVIAVAVSAAFVHLIEQKSRTNGNAIKWWRSNGIAVAAAVGALAAVGVATWEGYENRRHNRLSVRPQLDLKLEVSSGKAGWVLSNVGVGPAIPRAFEIFSSSERLTSWAEFPHHVGLRDSFCGSIETFQYGEFIPPGNKRRLFWVNDLSSTQQLLTEVNKISMELCYCSIYEDCWTVHWPTRGAQVPEHCGEVEDPEFDVSSTDLLRMIVNIQPCDQETQPLVSSEEARE